MNENLKADLIYRYPRIFKRMSAATHDLEVCVTFHDLQDKHYYMLNIFCEEVQHYLDYMNSSTQNKIPQVVIEEARYTDNRVSLKYAGGNSYVSNLEKEFLTEKIR